MPTATFEIFLDDEEEGFSCKLDAKWLAKPLIKGLITPFLDSLRKQRQNNGLYSTKHLARVMIDGVELAMAGPGSWHAPASEFVPPNGSSGPIKVELGLDLESSGTSFGLLGSNGASPISPTRRFKVNLNAGSLSSLTKRSAKPFVVHVRCHGVDMGATINRRWAEQSIRDAVIVPFFHQFDEHSTLGAPSSDEGIASLTLNAHDGSGAPLVFADDAEIDRLLASPVSRFATGALLELSITLKRSRGEEEVVVSAQGIGAGVETAAKGETAAAPPLNTEASYSRTLDRARRANSQRQLTSGGLAVSTGGLAVSTGAYLQGGLKAEGGRSSAASPASLIDLDEGHI